MIVAAFFGSTSIDGILLERKSGECVRVFVQVGCSLLTVLDYVQKCEIIYCRDSGMTFSSKVSSAKVEKSSVFFFYRNGTGKSGRDGKCHLSKPFLDIQTKQQILIFISFNSTWIFPRAILLPGLFSKRNKYNCFGRRLRFYTENANYAVSGITTKIYFKSSSNPLVNQ